MDSDWHQRTLDELTELLERDPAVAGAVLFGSLAAPPAEADAMSDIDVIVALNPGVPLERYAFNLDWLEPIGRAWARETSTKPNSRVLRVCFDDLRRIDVVIITSPASPASMLSWPDNPLRGPRRLLFARRHEIKRAVEEIDEPVAARPETSEQMHARVNAFLFEAHIAAKKVARRDLVIATHLTLGLARQCLELDMLLRDRAAGTRYHKHGASNDSDAVSSLPSIRGDDPSTLLDAIALLAKRFAASVGRYSSDVDADIAPLLRFIAMAREIDD